MANLAKLDFDEEIFLMESEPMQSRFTQERVKIPSESRFNRGYRKSDYEINNSRDLRKAISSIISGKTDQQNYKTSKGIYRAKMRLAQTLRDRNAEISKIGGILFADQKTLYDLAKKGKVEQRVREAPYKSLNEILFLRYRD